MITFEKLTADMVMTKKDVKPNGVMILLYKDARADMAILDRTVGNENWQKYHIPGTAICGVKIKNTETGEWITKEDIGFCDSPDPEMQKKGEASDAFKRACTCWGIGRELYTAPFIWFGAADLKGFDGENGTDTDYFHVDDITYAGDKIEAIKISVSCKGVGKYLTKTFRNVAPVTSEKPAAAAKAETAEKVEEKEPKKVSLPFPDDTTILIEELKGKRLGDVKNTKGFLRFLKWTTTRDVEYSTDEENEQFKKFKELALSLIKVA